MSLLENFSKTFFVFDLDDTIYKEKYYQKSGFKFILKILNYNIQVKKKINIEYLLNLKNPLKHIVNKFNLDKSYLNVLLGLYRLHKPNIKIDSKTKKFLNYLNSKSAGIAILTDGRSISQRQKLISLGLTKYPFFISEEFNDKKPNLKRFKIIMKRFNANRYIYIGDNLNKDFIAPNKLNWLTIGVKNSNINIHKNKNFLPKNFYPDIWINNILDLKKIRKF